MTLRSQGPRSRRFIIATAFALHALVAGSALGQLTTIISDGFGDGDLNNNGVPLEPLDARQGSYIPNVYGVLDGPPNPDATDPTAPTETGPRVPSLEQEISAGSLVLDPSDTGIRWFGASGFGSSGTDLPTARLSIIHDTAAPLPAALQSPAGTLNPFSRLPETLGSAASPTPTAQVNANAIHIPALDTGLALGYEASGSGTSATGFFGQTVALGDEVGDQLRVGFDFRIWGSAPNAAGNPIEDPAAPTAGELRFGIYRDTEGHIGQTNPTAGVGGTPAVFGEEPGFFRESSPGVQGAEGFYAEVPIGNVNDPATSLGFDAAGSESRIREDRVLGAEEILNPLTGQPIVNPFTGQPQLTAPERFLRDFSHTVAAGASSIAQAVPGEQHAVINNVDTHRVEFTLERALLTETDPLSLETTEYVGISVSLDVTNLETGVTTTLSGADDRDRDGDGVADGESNFFADEFDYIGFSTTGVSGGVQSADYDFIIDNFAVQVTGEVSLGLNCDAAGGTECDVADLNALYSSFGTDVASGSGFDYSGDGTIGPEDISGWLAEASTEANTANTAGDTYVLGDANLDGDVNSTDLGLLLNNFGSTSGVQWSEGDLNGSGNVDSTDLGLLLNNFGSTSASTSAVPEPNGNWILLLAFGLIFRVMRRTR